MHLNTRTTTQLLEGLRDPANHAAWGPFDERYRPILEGIGRRLGLDAAGAADAAQESLTAFFEAYRAGRYARERGRLRSWLMGIARRKIADQRARTRVVDGGGLLDDLPDDDGLAALWSTQRRAAILRSALSELRRDSGLHPRTIDAFERLAIGTRSAAEIAAELGMTRQDVYMARHRVTERVRPVIDRLEALYDAEE